MQIEKLPAVTQAKLQQYKKLLVKDRPTDIPFWDVIVLSSGDEEQKRSYEKQITLKKNRSEIPSFIRYLVTCDPPGEKIGNGGATMHVLEWLRNEMGIEDMLKAKVMLIHAGGYSQRLPNVSVIGKAFMALPCGNPMLQMLDALLMMYMDLPARMDSGVFLTSSDVIFLYNAAGKWDMKQPGITAIAHPISLDMATSHGVFVLDGIEKLVEKYRQNPEEPSMMGLVKSFLHKVSKEQLDEARARIPGSNQVYADIGYYFDWSTAEKLVEFYVKHKPLTCEIDAYGDFLQALGCGDVPNYCSNTVNVTFATDNLVDLRKRVFEHLQGTELRVVIFNQSLFNHIGTTAEYIHHFFSNPILIESYSFQTETMVGEDGIGPEDQFNSESSANKLKQSYDGSLLMHSILRKRSSVSIGMESVVEYCILEPDVTIGERCIISNVHLPNGTSVPDGSFLHTVPLHVAAEEVSYATFAFDISDNMKASVSKANIGKLMYCKKNMAEACKILFGDEDIGNILPTTSLQYTLWYSCLFPTFPTRQQSASCAVNMIKRLKGMESGFDFPKGHLVSVADMLRMKLVPSIIDYHEHLRKKIITYL